MTRYSTGKISDKTYVEFHLIWQGRDLIVKISGGDSHIGSLAFSTRQPDSKSLYQQFTYPTHREDQIVRECLERLVGLVPNELLIVCGIHYDDISKESIRKINENCSLLIERIAGDLKSL